jgi:hypothetical protein
MVRFVGTLRRHYPCAIAAGMWCGEVATIVTGGACMAIPWHELLGAATLGVTVWALLRHYLGERPDPGMRMISDVEFAAAEEAMARAVAECYASQPEPDRQRLRSVPRGA